MNKATHVKKVNMYTDILLQHRNFSFKEQYPYYVPVIIQFNKYLLSDKYKYDCNDKYQGDDTSILCVMYLFMYESTSKSLWKVKFKKGYLLQKKKTF